MWDLPDLKPGPTKKLRDWMNGLLALGKSCRIVTPPGSGLESQVGVACTTVRIVNSEETLWIKLTAVGTGANPPYAWIEQVPIDWSMGAWQDGFTSGTISPLKDAAYEVRQTALDGSLLPMVVDAWRDKYTNQIVFRAGVCS